MVKFTSGFYNSAVWCVTQRTKYDKTTNERGKECQQNIITLEFSEQQIRCRLHRIRSDLCYSFCFFCSAYPLLEQNVQSLGKEWKKKTTENNMKKKNNIKKIHGQTVHSAWHKNCLTTHLRFKLLLFVCFKAVSCRSVCLACSFLPIWTFSTWKFLPKNT